MAGQKIKQGNIFGRIGTGLGKGLAEQIPKEIERNRLASGLKDLGNQEGLSPFQQFSALASIPGITPQMLQSGSELLRHQSQANAYKNGLSGNQRRNEEGRTQQEPRSSPDISGIKFGNYVEKALNAQQGQQMPPVGQVNNQQATPNQQSNENVPQTVEGNALNKQNQTRLPWTPQERNDAIGYYIDKGFLPDQAKSMAADDEARDLAEPAAYQQRLKDVDEARGKIRDTLKRHLETKLQKEKGDVFKDVEGRMILNAERGMERDLIENPKKDVENAANDWSERLYQTAIAKGKLKTLGSTTGIESIFKGDTSLKKLKEYQNIFKSSGNLEEFKNILQGDDFGMSAQGAASVAYPPNQKIDKILSDYKSSSQSYDPANKYQEARKIALDVENSLGPDDSVLSIVRKLSEKDPYFDQQAFIDQISEDKDRIGLNQRQRLELAEGVANIVPNWADLLYLPIFKR